MHFSSRFYRAAAVCSILSAGTTLLLIFLPKIYGPATSLEHRIELVQHPLYLLRAYVYLFHPFLVLTAALGVATALRYKASGAVAVGFLGFLLWACTEAAQQTLTLTTFHRWANAYRTADAGARETLRGYIGIYDALWDAMFLLLLLAFFAGNVLYAIATSRGHGLTHVLSFFYIGAALLTLDGIVGELHGPTLPGVVSFWIYPLLQPAARFLIGVWLWRIGETDAES